MKNELDKLIGNTTTENRFESKMRFHQGWWRAFVLCQTQGAHPETAGESICNMLRNGHADLSNFVSQAVKNAVYQTLEDRTEYAPGRIDEKRLFNNLLSSQPLCFNFFGELKSDSDFALQVLKCFFPHLIRVSQTLFEFAPRKNPLGDNSAFDVAFKVEAADRTGLIGLECKFTDNFSQTEYHKDTYRAYWKKSGAFAASYESLKKPRFNQLFRNQLMAEAMILNGDIQFAHTGLFCHPADKNGIKIAEDFQDIVKGGDQKFRIITYTDFIEAAQRLDLSWERRETIMVLWARYLGSCLSERVFDCVTHGENASN